MRNRIVAVLLPLLILLAAAIAIPAGAAMAQRHSSDMLGDRILDASRFASLAQDGMEGPPERIRRELDEYADLYDSAVHVVSRNGDTIHSTSGELAPESIVEAAGPALAGRPPLDDRLITPLGPDRVVVATPVGHDSQVVGAVIIDAPTDAVRARILRDWLLVLVAALVPLTVVLLALGPVTDWMLRPLARFEATIARMRRGSLELRADETAGPPELRGVARTFNAFAEAVETLERMDALVTDLLEAAQHTDPGERTATVLATVPREGWEETARRHGATLRVDLPETAVVEPVGGLEPLIGELIVNAVRLGGAATVEVTAASAAGYVVLTVDDDGTGMTEEERERATDRLWRSPRVQNVPGTGLGLSIVARAVEESGGALVLEDSPAGGLRVVLRLVRADASLT